MLQEPDPSHIPLQRHCSEALATAAELNRATAAWHRTDESGEGLLLQLHRANFDLWHLEDQARDAHGGDATIAKVKREIDRVNQRRNDTTEAIDTALLSALAARQLPLAGTPLHSETPGQMLDRLSILSLKIFHTVQEIERAEVDEEHRNRNRSRLASLEEQQQDLACCLQDLWRDVLAGHRRIKLYRQHKMYNDPALNPVLYRPASAVSPTSSAEESDTVT